MDKIVIGGKKKPPTRGPDTGLYEGEMNVLNRRLKVVEERYANLRSRTHLMEQNMLHKNNAFYTEIKTVNLEMTEIKKELSEVKDNLLRLIKELEGFAKKEDMDVIRKYIQLWNPMNFVTKDMMEDSVREVIDKMRREPKY